MKLLMILTTLIVSAAGFVDHIQACVPGLEIVQDYRWEPPGAISICVLPDGAARTYSFPGQEVSAALYFRVDSGTSGPHPIPVAVEWIHGGPEVGCDPFIFELVSDPEGWVTWTPDLQGGGHRGPDEAVLLELFINLCPNQLVQLLEGVYFNSPDISGDLKVDLVDIQLFAGDFFGDYEYRSDFNWDGAVNLMDIPFMAQAVGLTCE